MSTRTAPYVTIENTTVHIHDECPIGPLRMDMLDKWLEATR